MIFRKPSFGFGLIAAAGIAFAIITGGQGLQPSRLTNYGVKLSYRNGNDPIVVDHFFVQANDWVSEGAPNSDPNNLRLLQSHVRNKAWFFQGSNPAGGPYDSAGLATAITNAQVAGITWMILNIEGLTPCSVLVSNWPTAIAQVHTAGMSVIAEPPACTGCTGGIDGCTNNQARTIIQGGDIFQYDAEPYECDSNYVSEVQANLARYQTYLTTGAHQPTWAIWLNFYLNPQAAACNGRILSPGEAYSDWQQLQNGAVYAPSLINLDAQESASVSQGGLDAMVGFLHLMRPWLN